jgi:hypothetical protein
MFIKNSPLIIEEVSNIYLNRINTSGVGNCIMRFFSGEIPQSPSFPPNSTNLFTITLPDPAVQRSGVDLILLCGGLSAGVQVPGRVGWFRFINKNGIALFDGTVGLINSRSTIELTTIDLEQGNVIRFTNNHVLKYGC